MRLIFTLTLLAFPIAEIWLLISLFNQYGFWILGYLIVIGYLGLQLIRDEKQVFTARIQQGIMAGKNPIRLILGSASNMIAGVLLIIPGVISDIIAAILLLYAMTNAHQIKFSPHSTQSNSEQPASPKSRQAANDDIIEGEFRREDE